MTEAVWYRVDAANYAAPVDEYERPMGEGSVGVHLGRYRVLKETPKGVWLNWHGDKKFVLRNARKRWAAPTAAEAWESFIARKRRQICILHAQAKRAELVLKAAHLAQLEGKESRQLSPYSSEAFTEPYDGGYLSLLQQAR